MSLMLSHELLRWGHLKTNNELKHNTLTLFSSDSWVYAKDEPRAFYNEINNILAKASFKLVRSCLSVKSFNTQFISIFDWRSLKKKMFITSRYEYPEEKGDGSLTSALP